MLFGELVHSEAEVMVAGDASDGTLPAARVEARLEGGLEVTVPAIISAEGADTVSLEHTAQVRNEADF